jgi:hypothetical protein
LGRPIKSLRLPPFRIGKGDRDEALRKAVEKDSFPTAAEAGV